VRVWSLLIFCARATRGRGLPSLDARSGRSISLHPQRENKRAWREHVYRSMRAVETTPAASLNAGMGEGLSSGSRWTCTVRGHLLSSKEVEGRNTWRTASSSMIIQESYVPNKTVKKETKLTQAEAHCSM
jgi:hypothetical protein